MVISSKYNAYAVAKGFKRKQGVDFDKIFSIVVEMTTSHMRLSLVAKKDLELGQLNVKTVFFHGDSDEIYMDRLEGCEIIGKVHLYISLRKACVDLHYSWTMLPKG